MLDISKILEGWEYDPDEVTVRLIEVKDGSKKLQMRLDLGLLQMEYTGRPDGKRPHGYESLFEYFKHQMAEHAHQYGNADTFFLDPDDCAELRREAEQYYYRYLSLFHLEDYLAVRRDTARNLRVFDFIRKYAEDEDDKYMLEQFRPYVLMMHARSTAHIHLLKNEVTEAIAAVEKSIERIRRFFKRLGRIKLAERCSEVIFLKRFLDEIKQEWIADPLEDLQKKMQKAVDREDYEEAAVLRDEIKKLKTKPSHT